MGEVGERLAAAGPGPQRRVGRRGRGEAGRVAAVGAVGMGGGRYPPPRGPHLVVADLRPRGQPEDGERVRLHEPSVRSALDRRPPSSAGPSPERGAGSWPAGPPRTAWAGATPATRSRPRRDLHPARARLPTWKTGPAGHIRTSPRDFAQPTA